MIADLKPYPVMKDSGVPWLGEVPAHWRVGEVKRYYTIQLGKMLQGRPIGPEDVEVPYLKAQHVQWFSVRTSDAPKMYANPRDVEQFGIAKGDLLVCEGGEAGRCGLVRQISGDFIIQNALHRARPKGTCRNDFLSYVMNAVSSTGWFEAINSKATIAHFTREKFSALCVPIPKAPEQSAVVRFLDYMDWRIRKYIRAKQKLIKLLEEQKQAIIHRAVTRGLDPNAGLKPSGVEWLGDVPVHWGITRLKFIASQIIDCLHATPVYSEGGEYPAIRTADVKPGHLLLESTRRVDEEHYRRWTDRMVPVEGDILYTREGERFGIAALVPADVRLCISQRMMAFRIRPSHNSAYVMWQINCRHVYAQAATDLIGAAAPHVNVNRIKNFWLALPPRAEQDKIMIAVEQASKQPNAAIQSAHREIALLREYRTRLIADVVTGKLDVREVAAQLPEEADEPEPLDDMDTIDDEEESADDLETMQEEVEA